MPNFDRTGPEGKGPRTGRGKGRCNKSDRRSWKKFLKMKINSFVNKKVDN